MGRAGLPARRRRLPVALRRRRPRRDRGPRDHAASSCTAAPRARRTPRASRAATSRRASSTGRVRAGRVPRHEHVRAVHARRLARRVCTGRARASSTSRSWSRVTLGLRAEIGTRVIAKVEATKNRELERAIAGVSQRRRHELAGDQVLGAPDAHTRHDLRRCSRCSPGTRAASRRTAACAAR